MSLPSNLPPAFLVGAHYDTFLQRALRRFFERAALETEALPSPSSDGRLAIESTEDPTALLHQLTSAALARNEPLRDLSVSRPTLEDVYLELTAERGEEEATAHG